MNVNDDFSQRIVMHGSQIPWEEAAAGLYRQRLDRVVGNYERATTIVRCDSNCVISSHEHNGGEELLVLEGTYEDEYGSWPKGSYVRNPPGSIHSPHSDSGCIVFMKLWQFDPYDRSYIHTNINKLEYIEPRKRLGVAVASLYQSSHESVRIEKWSPHAHIEFASDGGAEVFIIEGSVTEACDHLKRHSWLRMPASGQVSATAGPDGALVWVKTNHLANL